MTKKILLIGCGQLGSRHLQAAASLLHIGEIHIVDPNPDSLALGKKRLQEIDDLNRQTTFRWFQRLDSVSKNGDLCIIATQAAGRSTLLKNVVQQLNYKKFFIEKIVSPSVTEYRDLIRFCDARYVKVWVDCKTRAYSIHRYIKSRLNSDEPILFSDMGGNHGLANNGIHSADLFIFYDASSQIVSRGSNINSILLPSKRGKAVFDLSGTLLGSTQKGSHFMLSFSPKHTGPNLISLMSTDCRFIVDHFQKFAYESYAKTNWQWQPVPIDENWSVSYMSKQFIADILSQGNCELPTLADCFPAHEYILSALLPHFNRLLKVSRDYCPVT